MYGQYQCQRVLQQKPDAKEGASGTDTDESAGGTAYADGDGTAAAGKRLSGRRDGFPGEKIYFRGEEKCETGYGRAGRAFAGCPDAADPQSCLESCRGMQRYYGGTFAGSGGPSGKQTGRYVKLPYGLTATRVYNVIEIMGKRKETEKICLPIDTDRLPENLLAGEWKFSFKKFLYDGNTDKIPRKMYTKWFDYDKIKDSLAIRNRRKGDYFVLDAAGHHKKLEDYFVNEKIPASHRDEQLLLAGEDEIFWIVGGRMAYGTGISDATRWVLEITASNSSH